MQEAAAIMNASYYYAHYIYCEPSGIHHRSPGYNSALPHLQKAAAAATAAVVFTVFTCEYWRNEHTQWITFRTTTASIFYFSLSLGSGIQTYNIHAYTSPRTRTLLMTIEK
jgi:nicotinamidase-related amidase